MAGSLRRRQESVGDVEIVYVPKFGLVRGDDLFETEQNLAYLAIERLELSYVLGRRVNVLGNETFGARNKLMVHKLSGIPVDLFEATNANWWNYLVCRTGSAASNVRIDAAARNIGLTWKPYSPGFERLADGKVMPVLSEREVFDIVGLPYLDPWERDSEL